MSPRFRSLLKLILLIAFLTGAVLLVHSTPLGEYLDIAHIRTTMEDLGPLLSRLAYVLLYIVCAVLLFPGLIISFVGAILFGAYEGTLYTWIGATIGASLSFLISRALGREYVEGLLGGRLADLDRRLGEHGFSGVVALRLVPVVPYNGVNVAAGFTAIRFRDFALGTAIGIIPGTFVYQFLFARFGEKILARDFSWADLLDPILGLALLLFTGFLLAGKWISRRWSRSEATRPAPAEEFEPRSCQDGSFPPS